METYSSPISVASFWACVTERSASLSSCGADTVDPVADGRELASWSSSLRTTFGSAPTADSRGAVRPSPCASSAPSRCTGFTSGLPATVAAWAAAEMACWVFVVGLKASIGPLTCARRTHYAQRQQS